PPPGAFAAAHDLLHRLGAMQDGRIAPLGQCMLALGTHPRVGALLLAPGKPGERALACDLAAVLEARDPLQARGGARSDAVAHRWQALAAFRAGRTDAGASRLALAAIDTASKQWRRRLRVDTPPP